MPRLVSGALLSVLLDRGFDPHQRDKKGETLWHQAATNGSSWTFRLLREHADVHVLNMWLESPLIVAVRNNEYGIVSCMIARRKVSLKRANVPFGTNINQQDRFGDTALQIALRKVDRIIRVDIRIVDWIMGCEGYVNLHIRNDMGMTADRGRECAVDGKDQRDQDACSA